MYPFELSGKSLELYIPQRSYETRTGVKVREIYRLDNQQLSPEQGKVRRSSVGILIGTQATGDPEAEGIQNG